MSAGTCRAFAKLERDCFQTDDIININLDIDNSHCNQAIKRIKTSLKREIICHGDNGKAMYKKEEKLGKTIHHGIDARS